MKPTQENQQLYEALEEFETALETPVLPGELSTWAETVRRQSGNVTLLLQRQVVGVHAAQCDEIAEEDSDLLQCADHLRATDQALLTALADFDLQVFDLPEKAQRAEPDEAQFAEEIRAICAQGIAIVIAVRKQEVAIGTWLVEAFNRDLGEV